MFLLSINQYVLLLELKVSIKCTEWWRYVRSWLNQSDMRSGFDMTPQLVTWSTSNPLTAGAAFLAMLVARPLNGARSRCDAIVNMTMAFCLCIHLCARQEAVLAAGEWHVLNCAVLHFLSLLFFLFFTGYTPYTPSQQRNAATAAVMAAILTLKGFPTESCTHLWGFGFVCSLIKIEKVALAACAASPGGLPGLKRVHWPAINTACCEFP